MTVTRVKANGIELAVEETGRGPPLVALHGGMMERRSMLQLLAPFAKSHRVVAPDLRGHGESELPDAPWDYDVLGRDLLALVDAMKLKAPIVVGFSDGANMALAAAVARPELASRLVLAGPVNHDSPHYRAAFLHMLGQPLTDTFDVARFAREQPELAGFTEAMQGPRWTRLMPQLVRLWARAPGYTPAQLARIRAPTLYLFGEEDIISTDEMRALQRETPGSELQIVEGDHAWPLALPGELAERVAAFMR